MNDIWKTTIGDAFSQYCKSRENLRYTVTSVTSHNPRVNDMLMPPLSVLSDDLLGYIVEHVAELSNDDKQLQYLSLADRAFTYHCQKYLFRTLRLQGSNNMIIDKLKKIGKILTDNRQLADKVRVVRLSLNPRNMWLLNSELINIFQLFVKSPRPPHELGLDGIQSFAVKIEDPILLVKRLTRSFFSQTLTSLSLSECRNVPVSIFLICPQLRIVKLDHVAATKQSYDHYPKELCFGRESPALENFNYRDSHSLIKEMITPPPRFRAPVVLWSSLRVLTLSPHEKKEMVYLQPILNTACNTLEELFLTNMCVDACKFAFLSE